MMFSEPTTIKFAKLLLLISLFLVAGCQPNQQATAKRLTGTWVMIPAADQEKFKNAVDEATAKKLARESRRIDQEVLDGFQMTVRFGKGAVLETRAKQQKVGNWYFRSFDPLSNTAEVHCELEGEQIVTKVRFVTDDIVCMIPPNISVLEKEIVFERMDD